LLKRQYVPFLILQEQPTMKSRFPFIALLSFGLCAGSPAQAQSYPVRPVKILVGFPPGQATDILARIIAEKLQQELKQPFVVENRPGAGGTLAVAAGAKSPADGYTLVMTSAGPHSIAPSLYRKLGYDPLKDFTAISLIATIPQFIYAGQGTPVATVRGLIDLARKSPGTLSYASSGNGLPGHIIMETFKKDEGIDITHIPYRGSGPALTDVAGGSVGFGVDTAAAVLPLYRAGKVKVLGVTSRKRTGVTPEVLSMAEQGFPAFDFSAWIGIVAPANLPPPVTRKLSGAINAILANPETAQRIAGLGMDVAPLQSAQFDRWIHAELKRWSSAVERSGAKLD
jgi:tripartite-type tricarboxylate transporter receptor subunit TctC